MGREGGRVISGGWYLDRHFQRTRLVWGADGMVVCCVEDRGGETPEIANAIAAAPELLAACKATLNAATPTLKSWDDLRALIAAAIAKAEGR